MNKRNDFTSWLESRKELAKAYKDILVGVPQDPVHHPEGDTFTHSKLVRRAIPNAILELKYLQQNDPQIGEALADIDFNVSSQEEKILALVAWLHDIGKVTATTIDDRPWHEPGPPGKIRSIGHQDAEHYKPQLERLRQYAPPETIQLYLDNQELVNFLIEHHMDLMNGQFSRKFIAENFEKGKVKNTLQMKLLLILMWADKMGRRPENTIAQAIAKHAKALTTSIKVSSRMRNEPQSKPFEGSPEEFAQLLNQKTMAPNQKAQALKGKFPHLSR